MNEFSKPDKRAARAIFELALQREFSRGLNDFYNILYEWKTLHPRNNRDAYYAVFNAVKKFDKHIAQRYDDQSGNRYFITVISLLADGTISEDDLGGFSEQTRKQLVAFSNEFNDKA
ncbi:MAG: hypothetical protein ACYCZO_05470 [Daejeonella sp.]